MTFMSHVRSVDKGAFLLVREGVNLPMRGNYMVKFHSLNHENSGAYRGFSPWAPDPMPLKKIHAPQPEFLDPPIPLSPINAM